MPSKGGSGPREDWEMDRFLRREEVDEIRRANGWRPVEADPDAWPDPVDDGEVDATEPDDAQEVTFTYRMDLTKIAQIVGRTPQEVRRWLDDLGPEATLPQFVAMFAFHGVQGEPFRKIIAYMLEAHDRSGGPEDEDWAALRAIHRRGYTLPRP